MPSAKPPEAVATSTPSQESEVPGVPGLSSALRGLNAGITLEGVHDSITGWLTLATPAVSYSFNDIFSVDVSVPIYFFRLAPTTAARPRPKDHLLIERGEVGDVVLAGHAQFVPRLFQYQLTAALALPTGPAKNGLTTGRVSVDFTNHLERTLGRLTPTLDIGLGDSMSLVNRITTKSYTALGPLAHFQLGAAVQLPRRASFSAAAYEQLPVADQKTYGPSRNGKTVVTGRNITEDNGFISTLDLHISGHTTLSTYYVRGLRFATDAISIGMTYILRPPPGDEDPEFDPLFR